MDQYCHEGSIVGGSPSIHSKTDLALVFLQCVVECVQKRAVHHARWWLGKSLTISNGHRLSETQHTSSALHCVKFVWLHSVKDLVGLSTGVLMVGDSWNNFCADLAGILRIISSLQCHITPTHFNVFLHISSGPGIFFVQIPLDGGLASSCTTLELMGPPTILLDDVQHWVKECINRLLILSLLAVFLTSGLDNQCSALLSSSTSSYKAASSSSVQTMALHTTSTHASCGGGVISSKSFKDCPSPEPSGGVAFAFLDLMATMLSPLVWFFLFFVKAQSSFSSIAAQALSSSRGTFETPCTPVLPALAVPGPSFSHSVSTSSEVPAPAVVEDRDEEIPDTSSPDSDPGSEPESEPSIVEEPYPRFPPPEPEPEPSDSDDPNSDDDMPKPIE
ncbi:hypothetical protein BD769DRAFT_1676027 [Suillus cothurnatus]|nr:hypothetical protein BD769DRAFT_1676027 [Suillus cothurnatus]